MTAIYLVQCSAHPGLHVPLYIRAAAQPTHEQINAVWLDGRPDRAPLKDPAARRAARSHADLYPCYLGVERLTIVDLVQTEGPRS